MIHLNIGSNLKSVYGDKLKNISIAIDLLRNLNIKIKKISSFYKTPSYPNKNLPQFLNIGMIIETSYDCRGLLKQTSIIEKKIGRVKSYKNFPRVCDIDIIDFNGLIQKQGNLNLPHPSCHARNFVLYPILEIDPTWIHPILKKNVDFLIKDLGNNSRIEITRMNKSVNIKR